jgi:predicted DNA-binding protein YlxM (UPF0122 family)
MNTEKHEEARDLYFQTDMSKSAIADKVGISRRTIHYWIKEGSWDRLKKASEHMPSLLAENCYHIIAHFQEHLLSEHRDVVPVSRHEAETLYRLVLSATKLKNRSTINESMEMFGWFLEGLKTKDAELAKNITPHMEKYMEYRASVYASHVMPERFNERGYLPIKNADFKEQDLDSEDFKAWREEGSITPGPDAAQYIPEAA